jgi:methionyl-tRNA formyltransferase
VPQDPARATYAAKIGKPEAAIDWSLPAEQLARQVRALNPSPGAEATLASVRIKIWEAEVAPTADVATGVLASGPTNELLVGCGTGALRLVVVQRPGGRRMSAAEFLRGNPWPERPGEHATH